MTLTDINFKCTGCGQRLVADATGAGSQISCPVCALDLTIPPESSREASSRRNHVRAENAPEAEINNLRADHDRAAAALAQTETELKQLVAEQANWTEARRRLENSRTQAEHKLQEMVQSRDALAKELAETRQRLAAVEARLGEQDAAAQQARARDDEALAQLQAERGELEQKLRDAIAANHGAPAPVDAPSAPQTSDLEHKLQVLLAEREEMQASLGRKQERLKAMETRLLERDAEVRQQIAASEAEWNEIRARLETERTHFESKLQEVLQEREAYTESLARNRQRVSALETRLLERDASARQELAAMRAEWDEERLQFEARLAAAQLKLAQANEQAQAVSDVLEVNHQRSAALEAQLAERERSWQERGLSIDSLREELSATEARMVELETELNFVRAHAAEIPSLQAEIQTLRARIGTVEAERDSLQHLREEADLEIASLKKGLADSKRGRELLDLRSKVKETERDRAAAERRCQEAEKEAARAKATETRWREDCEQLLRRYQEAEARALDGHDTTSDESRSVLKGIIERQAAEISERAREVARLRRGQFGMRMAYALVALAALGVTAVVVKFIQAAL